MEVRAWERTIRYLIKDNSYGKEDKLSSLAIDESAKQHIVTGKGWFNEVAKWTTSMGMQLSHIIQADEWDKEWTRRAMRSWLAQHTGPRVYRLHQPVRNASDMELVRCVTFIGENWRSDIVTLDLFQTTTSIVDAREFLFPADILADPSRCEKRAFLSPLNIYVDDFNKSILERLSPEGKLYYSYDSIAENERRIRNGALAENDFLHAYEHPTLPPHVLHLKVGAVCRIMRLLDAEKGLVKNARVVIHELHEKYVTVRLLGMQSISPDCIHPISRSDFFHQPRNAAFTFHRRQLPLRLAYSTTFHSCLGLTLDKIVLDLRTHVFAHGQLYTALTRIRRREDVLILQNDTSPIVTTHIIRLMERGTVETINNSRKICPLVQLNPYQSNWMIKAQVTWRGPVREFDTVHGRGKVFNVELVDKDGTRIQVAMFNDAADIFHEKLQLRKVYYISRGTIRRANKRYSTTNNEYQIVLDLHSVVEETIDTDDIAAQMAGVQSFIAIDHLHRYVDSRVLVDVIGVVSNVCDLITVKRTIDNRDIAKRDITISDNSQSSVILSLWGEFALKDGETLSQLVNDRPIVTITCARVKNFQGVSLSTTSRSVIEINPDIPAVSALRSWYETSGKKQACISATLFSSRILLSEITSPSIGDGKPAYFNVRASITYINPDQAMWYWACTTCNKKPIEQESKFWCDKCQKYTDISKRYVFQAILSDSTAETTVTIFNEQGQQILGYAAEDLCKIREEAETYGKYLTILKQVAWVSRIFRISVLQVEYNGIKRHRTVVREVAPVEWVAESKLLIEQIAGMS